MTGHTATLVPAAPGHGHRLGRCTAHLLGQTVAMWSARPGPRRRQRRRRASRRHLLDQLRPGAIVDLHDGVGAASDQPADRVAGHCCSAGASRAGRPPPAPRRRHGAGHAPGHPLRAGSPWLARDQVPRVEAPAGAAAGRLCRGASGRARRSTSSPGPPGSRRRSSGAARRSPPSTAPGTPRCWPAPTSRGTDAAPSTSGRSPRGARRPRAPARQPGYVTDMFCAQVAVLPAPTTAPASTPSATPSPATTPARWLEPILLTSLLEAADRVDSTTGVQMAYLKQWAPRALSRLDLRVPDLPAGPPAGRCAATPIAARGRARPRRPRLPRPALQPAPLLHELPRVGDARGVGRARALRRRLQAGRRPRPVDPRASSTPARRCPARCAMRSTPSTPASWSCPTTTRPGSTLDELRRAWCAAARRRRRAGRRLASATSAPRSASTTRPAQGRHGVAPPQHRVRGGRRDSRLLSAPPSSGRPRTRRSVRARATLGP